LQRGFQLPRMQSRRNPALGTPELDSMFGVAPASLETSRLAQHSGGASDLKTRLRNVFNQDAPMRLADLELALRERDREVAGRLLHGMKGSAGYLEEQELQALCGDLEHEADHGNWAQVESAMPQLRRLLEQVRVAARG
jgi:HPt (histidine-containing phosphotransfer) domain-containing protein